MRRYAVVTGTNGAVRSGGVALISVGCGCFVGCCLCFGAVAQFSPQPSRVSAPPTTAEWVGHGAGIRHHGGLLSACAPGPPAVVSSGVGRLCNCGRSVRVACIHSPNSCRETTRRLESF
eukprot:scaffold14707_cov129-Isochrysis_galbana.AAC.2